MVLMRDAASARLCGCMGVNSWALGAVLTVHACRSNSADAMQGWHFPSLLSAVTVLQVYDACVWMVVGAIVCRCYHYDDREALSAIH